MRTDYKVIVLGLGGIGSGAAYWLSRRLGGDVLGLEQFEIGHPNGGSQDHSRIIRLSYHSADYMAFARHAYAAWAALEADAGEELIVRTGGLDFFPPDSVLPYDDYVEAYTTSGIEFETLDAAEVMRRWPPFVMPESVRTIFQADSGIAPAAKCNAAHIRMAREHGAVLKDNTPVSAIRPVDGEVEVVTDEATYRCAGLVMACGAWTPNHLADLGFEIPLRVSQEQVTYFSSPHLDEFAPDRFPIWIWFGPETTYGFPAYGEQAVKVARDLGGKTVTAETRSFDPDPENAAIVDQFVRTYLPKAHGPVLYTKTCLYTLTPDRDFIISAVPGHPNIALAVGAGHGFKFASVIGKALGEIALDGATDLPIEPFRADRATLTPDAPFENFYVD
jgi:sarcosine oxidase